MEAAYRFFDNDKVSPEKIMYPCHLGRECPDLDCEIIFQPSEWKSV